MSLLPVPPPEPGRWGCGAEGRGKGQCLRAMVLPTSHFPLLLREQHECPLDCRGNVLSLRTWSPRLQQLTLPKVLVKSTDSRAIQLPSLPNPRPPTTTTITHLPSHLPVQVSGAGPRNLPCSKFPGSVLWTLKFKDYCPRDRVRTWEHWRIPTFERLRGKHVSEHCFMGFLWQFFL